MVYEIQPIRIQEGRYKLDGITPDRPIVCCACAAMIAFTNLFSCGMVQNNSTTFCCGNTTGFTSRKGCITAYRLINACLSKRLAYHSQSWLNNTLWSLWLWHIFSYYSFKIFSRFWLVKATRIIHNNQLLFTKFGKNLRHIESMTSKVERTENYWANDVKMTSKVQPAADYWTVDRENLGTTLCYIWWAEKQRA